MDAHRQTDNISDIAKHLEILLEKSLNNLPFKRNDEQTRMCRVLFSHNIRYLRVYLGFIARGSPYEQQEFAGSLSISVAGLRRWENAEVVPNMAGLKNVINLSNSLLSLPTLLTSAHLLYCNLVTEIPLLRLGSHSAAFQNLSYKNRREFSSFMNNNMDLMLSHFMEKEFQLRINFHELMENVNVPIYLIKRGEETPTYVNEAMCDLQGFTRKELLKKPFYTTLHPDDLNRVMQLVQQRSQGEVSDTQYRLRIRHASGEYLNVHIRNRNILLDGEQFVLSTLHDITDFIEMQESLKISETNLRNIFAAMDDLVFVTDAEGFIREFYQPGHPNLYTNPEIFLNKRFSDVLPESTAKILESAVQNCIDIKESQNIEYELEIKGNTKTFSGKLSLLSNRPDYKSGLVLVVRDITEKINAEKALKDSEKKYRSLFQSMFDACALHEIITDKTGKPVDYIYLDINPAFEKLVGQKAKDLVGKTAMELFPESEPFWIQTYARVAQTGQSIEFTRYSKYLQKTIQVYAQSPNPGQFSTTIIRASNSDS